MDAKTLHTLEYHKVLERLAGYCAFAASTEKAKNLLPSDDIDEARLRLAETSEAVQMLTTRPDLTIGGARDIRQAVDLAAHGGVLTPTDLLDIKSTLIAARTLARTFERLEAQFPTLFAIASQIPTSLGVVDGITRAISERGEIMDSASEALATIRRDLRISHDRLMTKLQRMVSDPKTSQYLQEALITQRDGRYVLPLRSEFKGRVRAVVHDQSASGATLFVEPLSVVEHNNEFRELQLAERDEERRILAELSQQVAMQAGNILAAVERVADLDLCFAKAKYSDDIAANQPVLQPIPKQSGHHPGTIIRLYQARHPLLDPATVVPIDVELDAQTFAMVVTGPNTGGKTVTLKTIGLLALMAQSGLHIPAHSGSEISLFHNIYADIGDEQSIEQSLSTFSGHITNIIRILERADRRSLVILDELGAGTDPQEGAALARALLSQLLERGITTLVTTHHPELKAYAHATPGVTNASVEFDLETLRPTFHLTIGLPGRSNALAIAQRLGMPEPIITSARSELSPADLRAEDLLDEIHRQRDLSRKARSAAENARHEAEAMRNELAKRLEKIEDERMQILEKAHRQAEEQVEQVEAELREVRRQLARTRQPLQVIEEVEEKVEELQETVIAPVERRTPEARLSPIRRAIRLGDRVRLHSLNTQGVVTSLGEEEAEVQVGVLRIRARLAELQIIGDESSSATTSHGLPTARDLMVASRPGTRVEPNGESTHAAAKRIYSESPGIELDLRGQRSEEALDALERYLDSAYLAGLPWVRIIHGKGTGKLRLAVREALSHNPHVKSYESGGDNEGGEGVTVAKLAQ
jgi:DNA mismatch repair protein MutS2